MTPTLVLLHAFPLTSAMWAAQREALAGVCRLVVPNQRGFGGTPLGTAPTKLVGPATRDGRPEVLAAVEELASRAPAVSVAWAQRAMAARPDSSDLLPGVQVPALVVVGEDDGVTPPDQAEAMAAALPRATLERIPDAGHLSAMEDPARFNAALRRFVGGAG